MASNNRQTDDQEASCPINITTASVVLEVNEGTRTIRTVSTAVIGLVATSPEALRITA